MLGLACAAAAQAPRIGDINYYGLRKVTAEKIQAVTGLRKGGTLTASKGDIEDQIDKISGVVLVRVEALCCEATSVDLFIGIEERGAPHPAFHSPPAGNAVLPQELLDTYADFLAAVARAVARGNTTEDFTAGYSMMDDPEARSFQPRFLTFAADHFDWLRDVLRNSSDAGQRAVAAAVIGYGADKQQAAGELQYAIGDPDGAVRANAMRALAAIAVYARKQPDRRPRSREHRQVLCRCTRRRRHRDRRTAGRSTSNPRHCTHTSGSRSRRPTDRKIPSQEGSLGYSRCTCRRQRRKSRTACSRQRHRSRSPIP